MEKTVLETEERSGTDNSSLGEDVADSLLTTGLGAVELRGRILGDGVRGNVNEAVDIVLGDGIGNTGGTLDVDVLEIEVLGGVVATDQVVDNVGVADRLLNGSSVAEIHFLEICQRMLAQEVRYKKRRTRKTTRPRSPETLRWRLAISSRKGTTTVHPARAMGCVQHLSRELGRASMYRVC